MTLFIDSGKQLRPDLLECLAELSASEEMQSEQQADASTTAVPSEPAPVMGEGRDSAGKSE